jgi:hypothetical protein
LKLMVNTESQSLVQQPQHSKLISVAQSQPITQFVQFQPQQQQQKQFTHDNRAPVSSQGYDWTHVLTEKYKQNVNVLNFNCPRDGLFSHPHVCSQFLQCVDYGTVYMRFYVLNCPAGLYFNSKLDLCDYPYNVFCAN